MDIQTILANVKIERLNAMQEAMIEAWRRDGSDLVLLSPTGTGKTLACLIPLALSLRPDAQGVQAVVMAPSRELAQQTEQVFRSMATGFAVMSCHGGRPATDEHRAMRSLSPAVLVATPGRLNDHLSKGNFDARTVRTLVIDEFDKCLELGFRDEMAEVTEQLPALRRRILLSATDADEIPRFVGLGRAAARLDFRPSAEAAPQRVHIYKVQSPVKDKLETLSSLLRCIGGERTAVFCNHRESVERVGQYLRSMKTECETFHGGMDQDARERALYKFRNGSCHVFVCTDLAARGLDIPEIRNVVHYHLPPTAEGFVHRNGRTARWEADGNAYVILHPEESMPEGAEAADFVFPDPLPPMPTPAFATLYFGKGRKDKLSKADIVGFLSKKGGLGAGEIGRIDVKDHCAFAAVAREKARQTLRLVQGEKIKGMKTIVERAK